MKSRPGPPAAGRVVLGCVRRTVAPGVNVGVRSSATWWRVGAAIGPRVDGAGAGGRDAAWPLIPTGGAAVCGGAWIDADAGRGATVTASAATASNAVNVVSRLDIRGTVPADPDAA